MQRLQLEDKDKELVSQFLITVKNNTFTRQTFDYRRWQMDLALKQEFLDAAVASGDYSNYNLTPTEIAETTGIDSGTDYEPDAYSDLYVPLLLTHARAYLVTMKNLCFPANGDWLTITRGYSETFYKYGVEKFLPFVNDAWVDIIKTENQRFNCLDPYSTSMAECINYGNTVVGHNYNAQLHFLEPFAPGIGTAGIWPVTNNWRKSNICFYYDVNYGELLDRDDFDQNIIREIEPSQSSDARSLMLGAGSTTAKTYQETVVPFGKVRLYDFFVPSLYAKRQSGEPLVIKNLYVTAAIKPMIRDNSDLPTEEVYILKATENVSPVDHAILFAAFSVPMPGTFYQQGALQPFLPHQYIANQIISEASRSTGMVSNPPKSIEGTNGLMIDLQETPMPAFEAGALYDNVKVTPLIDPGSIANSLNTSLSYLEYLGKTVEEGVGISKGQLGKMHQGRKTATEVKESYSGSQLTVVEAAGRFDQQILRPSITIRISGQQKILREQVEAELSQLPLVTDESYEKVLSSNALYARLMNFSGIRPMYENFYKETMRDYLNDQTILQQVEEMTQQVMMMFDFADSPIPPPPPVPQVEAPDGTVVPTVLEIQQIQQMYLQEEQAKREQTRREAKRLESEIKLLQLTFKNIPEPPAASNKLFYEFLIAPVEDSDVVVTGSMTTVSKELARENLLMMLQAIPNFPMETIRKIDFDSILMLLSRANDIPLRDMLKDASELLKEEKAAEEKAKLDQELVMQMAQNPGAQVPKA